jgi:hypothetical protein
VLWRYWQGFVERTVCTPSSFLCRPAHSGGDVLSASVAHITTRTRPLARSPTKVSLSAMCIRIQTVARVKWPTAPITGIARALKSVAYCWLRTAAWPRGYSNTRTDLCRCSPSRTSATAS